MVAEVGEIMLVVAEEDVRKLELAEGDERMLGVVSAMQRPAIAETTRTS